MKHRIQILHVVQNAGRSKTTGNEYDMRMAQCIVHKTDKDGVVVPLVGELLLPKEYNETKPGTYDVEFDISVSNKDKRVGAVVKTIEPVVDRPVSKKPEQAAA